MGRVKKNNANLTPLQFQEGWRTEKKTKPHNLECSKDLLGSFVIPLA